MCKAILNSLNNQLENLTNLDTWYAEERVEREKMVDMLKYQIQSHKDDFKQ